jgi:hypothetical protein
MEQRSLSHPLAFLKTGLLVGCLCVWLLISGCIQSTTEINFAGQSGGEIVEHIKLAGAVQGLTDQSWLEKVQQQARRVGGQTQRPNPQQLDVVIPFDNGPDLARKLNQFVQPVSTVKGTANRGQVSSLPNVPATLTVTQQNFLLLLRNHFTYDVDLRSLGIQSTNGDVLLSPSSLVDLQLSLQTPWGARSIKRKSTDTTQINPTVIRQGKTLLWKLQPGYLNHLEAAFIYPSPVGWGAIAIILLVSAGLWYQNRKLA